MHITRVFGGNRMLRFAAENIELTFLGGPARPRRTGRRKCRRRSEIGGLGPATVLAQNCN